MKTVDALKALYVALGGSADDVANLTLIPEVITAIATVAATLYTAANAKELPAVSATDDGDVLGVVNGSWNKMTLPS